MDALNFCIFCFPVQNGAVTQKDTLNDDEFEPYLNAQPRQVGLVSELNKRTHSDKEQGYCFCCLFSWGFVMACNCILVSVLCFFYWGVTMALRPKTVRVLVKEVCGQVIHHIFYIGRYLVCSLNLSAHWRVIGNCAKCSTAVYHEVMKGD